MVATITAGDPIDPAVGAPQQAVHEPLNVVGAKPGEHHLLDVGHAVVIGVLRINDIRGDRNENAAIVGNNPGRPRQAIDKDRPRLKPAVAVAVFQACDVARRRFLRIRISPHLDDIEPPIGIIADADRVGDQRLDGHWLELENPRESGTIPGPPEGQAA